jgi:hypothetical protein
MNTHEAAAALNGCEYRDEGSPELFAQMKAAGLVAVFGYSDDGVELRGAIDEELGVAPFLVTRDGLLRSECDEGEDCPYFKKIAALATEIEPFDDPANIYTHLYRTEIPHTTFEVVEDGEPFCKGIVFALADVPLRAAIAVSEPS